MGKGFKVIKHHGDTQRGPVAKTQCGGTVKTAAKAEDLKARMRDQQPRGGSNWYTIERA